MSTVPFNFVGTFGWMEIESDETNLFDTYITKNQEEILEKFLNSIGREFLKDTSVKNKQPSKRQLKALFSDFEVPRNPRDVSDYFEQLNQDVISKTTRCGSPLLIGHMTSSLPFFQRPLAKLVATLHQNNVKLETSSFVTFLERETLAKLHHSFFKNERFFYKSFTHKSDCSLGCITSGGTLANFAALWVARNSSLGPCRKENEIFEGVEKEGLFKAVKFYGYEDVCIIGSQMMHYSIKKAADMLGLGTSSLITIPTDEKFCIKTSVLEERIINLRKKNILVMAMIGIAGTTETGSVDNLQEMARIAKKYGIHFHVDAAWGGPMIFSQQHAPKLSGIELADSITVDGHKQLYTPMGCGVILFKNPQIADAIKKTANYIIRSDSLDLGKYTPEGSRPANAIHLHASLCLLGVKGMERLMNRHCEMIYYMRNSIVNCKYFEIVSEPTLNILLYRWIPCEFRERNKQGTMSRREQEKINEENIRLQKMIVLHCDSFISRTTVFSDKYDGTVTALRAVIANPATSRFHIDYALREQINLISLIEKDVKSRL